MWKNLIRQKPLKVVNTRLKYKIDIKLDELLRMKCWLIDGIVEGRKDQKIILTFWGGDFKELQNYFINQHTDKPHPHTYTKYKQNKAWRKS